MNSFSDYNKIIFDAFIGHNKQQEIVNKKSDILSSVFEFYNLNPKSYLFIGFNPVILELKGKKITMIETDLKILNWIKQHNSEIDIIEFDKKEKYDCIIAMDEYFTFCNTDDELKSKIDYLGRLTNSILLTTVKDYKNQDFKDREYSIPAIIRSDRKLTAYTEIHDWAINDKNRFSTHLYELGANYANLCGSFSRRPIYFKQLARFCADSGSSDFTVHKNLMYKSLIKKNYEHVISINFEN